MNRKFMTALAVMLTVTVFAIQFVSTDADAFQESKDGIVITTVDEGDIRISAESGTTESVELIISNTTSDPVAIGVRTEGFGYDVKTSIDKPTILGAHNSGNYFGTIVVSFTIDGYAGNQTDDGRIIVTVLDANNATRSLFEIPVEIDIRSAYSSDDSYNKFFGLFPNTLGEPLDGPWATAIITFVIWIVMTVIAVEIVVPLLTRLAGARKTKDDKDKLRNQLAFSITALMVVMAINECLSIVGANPEIEYLSEGISNVLYVAIGAVIAWQIYLFVVTSLLKEMDEKANVDGMDMSLLPLFKMIGKLVIGVTGVCFALASFGVDLAGILVSAGVVTLGITLGAQNTLNQFFSGIVLLATRPFKKGDFVRIGDVSYSVRKVKLMYTEFMNWDADQIVTIPNNVVSSATIINLSKELGRTRVFAYVDVAYGSDVEKVKECLKRAGSSHPHVIKDGSCIPPDARLTNFGESGITFRLACYVDDFEWSADYAGELRELIYKELNENGIEIPYNRIQVDVLSEPSVP